MTKKHSTHVSNSISSQPSPLAETVSDEERITVAIQTAAKWELLQQARSEFRIYLFSVCLSVFIGGVGAVLLIVGKSTEGAVTAAAGLGSSAYYTQVGRESRDKLNRLAESLRSLE